MLQTYVAAPRVMHAVSIAIKICMNRFDMEFKRNAAFISGLNTEIKYGKLLFNPDNDLSPQVQ